MSVNIGEVNDLQTQIMVFIGGWVRGKRTPVPKKEIVSHMTVEGYKDFTTENAIVSLLKKGYIRKAVMISNQTFYVQLRSI